MLWILSFSWNITTLFSYDISPFLVSGLFLQDITPLLYIKISLLITKLQPLFKVLHFIFKHQS